ncbi:MAG: cupin domain-containing protein [Actinomycetota bacterium]|nr:cupin domain-containing protein [Actinomycetota bacterium]
MLTTTIERAEERRSPVLEEAERRDGARGAGRTRRSPMAVATLGLALMGLSTTALVLQLRGSGVSPAPPAAIAASEPPQVSTTELVYEPGQSSGWHVHAGVHSVVVSSGTLTVYDDVCRRRDFGPGETYVGGRQPHLVRNGGDTFAVLAVTYVADPTVDTPGRAVPAPSGCEAT